MKTETKWAVIAAIILFFILLLEKIFGLQTPAKADTWELVDMVLTLVLFIVVYYMVTREKRDRELNGVMSWGEGFWSAAIMTLIFIPLSTFLIYVFLKFVNPDAASTWAAHTGDLAGKDPINNFLRLHLVSAIMFGLLFSLVFPLFTKKEEG